MFIFRSLNLNIKCELRASISFVYGIGKHKANTFVTRLGFVYPIKVIRLNQFYLNLLLDMMDIIVSDKIKLIRISQTNILRNIDTGNYKGKRQKDNLPCHGQRTRTNAATRKRMINKFIIK